MTCKPTDLFLHYKFTDRGGKLVYEKYAASDRITMFESLGELRLMPIEEAEEQLNVIELGAKDDAGGSAES
jgi:hypothetical protein